MGCPKNFSIIIPHYNTPILLMRCLESIPVREDIQVIVVDDCSPNASEYLQKYPLLSRPYLEFYSTGKGGSSGRARNVGLEHAKGKWLLFADADDLFVEDLDVILNSLFNIDAEVVYFSFKSVMSENLSMASKRDQSTCYLLQNHPQRDIYARTYVPFPFAKMVSRALVEEHHIRFEETRWSNDFLFAVSVGCLAKNIHLDNRVIYLLCEREGSLTSKFCEDMEEHIIRAEVAIRCYNVAFAHHYVIQDEPYPVVYIMRKMWKRDKVTFTRLVMLLEPKAESLFYKQFCYGARWKRRFSIRVFSLFSKLYRLFIMKQ